MIVSRSMAEFLLGKDLPKPKGGGRSYFLLSKKTPHRNLGGPYKTKEEALERERQVQYFKRRGNPSSFHERDHDWDQPLALDGTTRKQIVRHYEKYGRNMLPYLKGHDVLVVIALGDGKFVYRRKGPDGRPIRIDRLKGDDPHSLEYWILRRAIEFHPTIGSTTDRVWIDVDKHGSKANARRTKAAIRREVPFLESVLRRLFKGRIRVYSSGKDGGLHIEMKLPSRVSTDRARKALLDELKKDYSDDELFTTKPCGKRAYCVRLDVTTLKNTGSIKAPYSYAQKGGYKKPL